jgi:hypothetical protein
MVRRSSGTSVPVACEELAGKKFAVFVLVEPRAFDVEKPDAGEAGDRERVDRELSDRLVRTRIRFVVQDVHGAVSDLDKIDVAGDHARRRGLGCEFDRVFSFDRCDVILRQPNRDLDGERHAVVCEHEALEGFVTQLVVADCRNDERGRFGRRVFLAGDDGVRGIREFRSCLGRARFDILFSRKKLVRADRGDAFSRCAIAGMIRCRPLSQ